MQSTDEPSSGRNCYCRSLKTPASVHDSRLCRQFANNRSLARRRAPSALPASLEIAKSLNVIQLVVILLLESSIRPFVSAKIILSIFFLGKQGRIAQRQNSPLKVRAISALST